jgi:para-nitrobenzyl esterase
MFTPIGPKIKLDTGIIEGVHLEDNIWAFKGIPYAAPPIEELRWRPPQTAASWKGTRAARRFSSSCTQIPPPENSLYHGGEKDMSEDCLYLNVWTGGAIGEVSGVHPVLVILHFGAYQFGSSSNPIYDGAAMARRGLVVVSINYRLGRMGFFAHPNLTTESGTNSSGNYGLMDQIAALNWVQRNIAAFGGDPDNVTLMGVSAGANSVHNLRSSALAKSLFHKCIVASGPGFSHASNGYGHPANPSTLAAGEAAGLEVADALGASTLKLRAMPAEKIIAVQLPRAAGQWSFDLLPAGAKISLHIFDASYPVIDGRVLTQAPLDALIADNLESVIDIPMLASNTGNEASGLPYTASLDVYRAYLESTFGTLAEKAFELYPANNDAEAQSASWQLLADQIFNWSTWTAARLQARRLKSKVWYARFLCRPPIPANTDLIEREYAGAYHGADIMYALGNLDARPWNWTDLDWQLSNQMMDAWVDFARTGDPDKSGDSYWPALNATIDGPVKIWDIRPRLDTTGPTTERTALWDRVLDVAGVLVMQ